MKSVNTELGPRLPEWGFFIAPSLRPGGRGSSVNMKNHKSVLVAHIEAVLQSFAFGGGTGKKLVKKLDKTPTAQHLGALYLKVIEDHPDCLILGAEETATLHSVMENLMQSFAHYGHRGYGGTGKTLIAAVRQYAAEEKDSPVTESEIALYLRLDAAMKREAKQAA